MSVFTTLIYGGNDDGMPIATFTNATLSDAAIITIAYLHTLGNVDVTDDFIAEQFTNPYTVSNQEPPRADGLVSVQNVGFNYKNDVEIYMMYSVHTTIHDRTCRCPIHRTLETLALDAQALA
jgi:hypothetical protein